MSISRRRLEWSITLLLVISIVTIAAYLITVPEAEAPSRSAPTVQEELPLTRENLLKLVNEERAKVGASPLVIDNMLNRSAQWKADDMTTYDYFGHIKPGETINSGLEYLKQLDNTSSDRCKYVSENLVWDDTGRAMTTFDAIYSWKNSELHYKAMIDPEYTLTGFGITDYIVVQHFCKP